MFAWLARTSNRCELCVHRNREILASCNLTRYILWCIVQAGTIQPRFFRCASPGVSQRHRRTAVNSRQVDKLARPGRRLV